MKMIAIVTLLGLGGCAEVIEPGHRGLFFDPRHGGLQHDVLGEGRHYVGAHGRLVDFDVTYSKKSEEVHTTSSDNLGIDVQLSLSYRPIVSQLYDLDVEVGENYYDEVVGPEFRTATRGVFARHGYLEVEKINEALENEIEAELRRRVAGKHVEISSVTIQQVAFGEDIVSAIRGKLVGEQEATRKKVEADAEMTKKKNEHLIADEQATIDKLRAETDSQVRVTRARAEAESISVLAKAHADEKRAEATTLTPLMVQMHAYDALARLGGNGTQIMLGDWSHVPSFLFPGTSGLTLAAHRDGAMGVQSRP